MTVDDDRYSPGANWISKDGERNIVIEREMPAYRSRSFSIRNLTTGRRSSIEITGLTRKFRFAGHAPVIG